MEKDSKMHPRWDVMTKPKYSEIPVKYCTVKGFKMRGLKG